MNNREWLYSLDVANLSDWFEQEHVEDTNGTLDGARDSVDAKADSCTDSREKLEADIAKTICFWGAPYPDVRVSTVIRWLDRQDAITRAECERR